MTRQPPGDDVVGAKLDSPLEPNQRVLVPAAVEKGLTIAPPRFGVARIYPRLRSDRHYGLRRRLIFVVRSQDPQTSDDHPPAILERHARWTVRPYHPGARERGRQITSVDKRQN
jgi:hypothetical protein